MKPWLPGAAIVVLAACDGGTAAPDAGYDAAQDSPFEAAPAVDAGADVVVDATIDAAIENDAADDVTVDASDAGVADAPDDTSADAGDGSADAGSCSSNAECPNVGYYCEKGNGNCGGTGTCTFAPQFCSNIVAPVCGCDGVTYNNACKAHRGLTSVDHTGNCP